MSVLRLMWECFRIKPVLFTVMVLFDIAVGPLAMLSTKLLGELVDTVTDAFQTGTLRFVFLSLLWVLLTGAASALARCIGFACEGKIRIRLEKYVQTNLIKITDNVEYLQFISEDFQKELSVVTEGFGQDLLFSFGAPFSVLTESVRVISYLVLVTQTAGFVAIIAFALTAAAAFYIRFKSVKDKFSLLDKNRTLRHKLRYIESLYRDPDVYAEMILFGSKHAVDSRYAKVFKEFETGQVEVSLKQSRRNVVLTSIVGAVTCASLILCFLLGKVESASALTVIVLSFVALLSSADYLSVDLTFLESLFISSKTYLSFRKRYTDCIAQTEAISRSLDAAAIDFRGVSFGYGDDLVLKGVDMYVAPGQMAALVGENGSGKTTLANIILGIYRKKAGETLVFGRDAFEARDSGTLDSVAVFQEFCKYNGHTLTENITFGDPVDGRKRDLINDLIPDADLEATVGNEFDGRDYSGGEWQKIALARCASVDAPLMILDEPTAALDPMAEAEVFDRFMKINRGKTAVLITHRLGAVRNADVIFVLKDGVVAEHGTHEELMQQNGYYAEMFNAQAQWYVTDIGEGGEDQ